VILQGPNSMVYKYDRKCRFTYDIIFWIFGVFYTGLILNQILIIFQIGQPSCKLINSNEFSFYVSCTLRWWSLKFCVKHDDSTPVYHAVRIPYCTSIAVASPPYSHSHSWRVDNTQLIQKATILFVIGSSNYLIILFFATEK